MKFISSIFPNIKYLTFSETKFAVESISAFFSGCRDTFLIVSDMFYRIHWRNIPMQNHSTLFSSEIQGKLDEVPDFSKKVYYFAENIASEILRQNKGFSCLHLRRGDFKDYCLHIDKRRKLEPPNSPYSKSYANFSLDNCFPNPMDVAYTISKKGLLPDDDILYIATNERDASILKDSFGSFMKWTWRKDWKIDVPEILQPSVEQVLCEHSSVFIGNRWSTFSRWIGKRRSRSGRFVNLAIGIGQASILDYSKQEQFYLENLQQCESDLGHSDLLH
jgi:hypothetical protein